MRSVLLQFEEISPGKGCPSVRESFCDYPFEGQDTIIDYFDHGRIILVSTGFVTDKLKGEIVPDILCLMTDGEYTWSSDLAHYVDRYNMWLDP